MSASTQEVKSSVAPAGRERSTIDSVRCARVLVKEHPFEHHMHAHGLWRRYHWPAKWIAPQASPPVVFAMRIAIDCEQAQRGQLHVSADERYALYLNGRCVGRGPERGDLNNWCFETYDLQLPPGKHMLVALCWAMGEAAPLAQISAGPAFLLAGTGDFQRLSTGQGAWQVKLIDGITTLDHPAISHDGYTGKKLRIDGRRMGPGLINGAGDGWTTPRVLYPATSSVPVERFGNRALRPAGLLPQRSAAIAAPVCRFAQLSPASDSEKLLVHMEQDHPDWRAGFDGLVRGAPLVVPPHTRLRAILDLQDYYCAYPHLWLSDGADATVRIAWAESLYLKPDPHSHEKGHRDELDGKYFRGFGDEFIASGVKDQHFSTLWWQAGRYVQIEVQTHYLPLSIDRLVFEETRYDFGELPVPELVDEQLARIARLCRRSLEVSCHENFTDSPYYEQLAYIGDVRLESLSLYALTLDDHPARKAIDMLGTSRSPEGFTQARYPCRRWQQIAPFSLMWIGMVHDYALWRGDRAFVASQLPAVRNVIDAFLRYRRSDGLISNPPGWNFVDWAADFPCGEPPADGGNTSGIINWHFVWTLRLCAELEDAYGEPELAARCRRLAQEIAAATHSAFWDESRGLWSDGVDRGHFSEHAQAMAILSGLAPDEASVRAGQALAGGRDMTKATIYFTHYVFEALRLGGHDQAIADRLAIWRQAADLGLRCLPESPEPTRSDSHAWGAHLLYHLIATCAGIRPAGFGFQAVRFDPRPAIAPVLRVTVPHPRGVIRFEGGELDSPIEVLR